MSASLAQHGVVAFVDGLLYSPTGHRRGGIKYHNQLHAESVILGMSVIVFPALLTTENSSIALNPKVAKPDSLKSTQSCAYGRHCNAF